MNFSHKAQRLIIAGAVHDLQDLPNPIGPTFEHHSSLLEITIWILDPRAHQIYHEVEWEGAAQPYLATLKKWRDQFGSDTLEDFCFRRKERDCSENIQLAVVGQLLKVAAALSYCLEVIHGAYIPIRLEEHVFHLNPSIRQLVWNCLSGDTTSALQYHENTGIFVNWMTEHLADLRNRLNIQADDLHDELQHLEFQDYDSDSEETRAVKRMNSAFKILEELQAHRTFLTEHPEAWTEEHFQRQSTLVSPHGGVATMKPKRVGWLLTQTSEAYFLYLVARRQVSLIFILEGRRGGNCFHLLHYMRNQTDRIDPYYYPFANPERQAEWDRYAYDGGSAHTSVGQPSIMGSRPGSSLVRRPSQESLSGLSIRAFFPEDYPNDNGGRSGPRSPSTSSSVQQRRRDWVISATPSQASPSEADFSSTYSQANARRPRFGRRPSGVSFSQHSQSYSPVRYQSRSPSLSSSANRSSDAYMRSSIPSLVQSGTTVSEEDVSSDGSGTEGEVPPLPMDPAHWPA